MSLASPLCWKLCSVRHNTWFAKPCGRGNCRAGSYHCSPFLALQAVPWINLNALNIYHWCFYLGNWQTFTQALMFVHNLPCYLLLQEQMNSLEMDSVQQFYNNIIFWNIWTHQGLLLFALDSGQSLQQNFYHWWSEVEISSSNYK